MRDREKHHSAVALTIPMVVIVAIFCPKWIWLALLAAPLIILAEQFPKRQRERRAEEDKEMSSFAQATHTDLEKMEKRIEALETILVEGARKRERGTVNSEQ